MNRQSSLHAHLQEPMNASSRVTENDLCIAWARQQLDSVSAHALKAWCQRLHNGPDQLSLNDWLALRVLSGDLSAWTAIAQESPSLAEFQWHQLQQYQQRFFDLPASDKRQQHAALIALLQGNPAALSQLSRFERFLDLEEVATDEIDDATQLLHWLIMVCVSGPLRRQICLENLTHITEREPLRWRRAALLVMKQPQWSQLAPTLTTFIASMQGQLTSERQLQTARRRAFSKRFGARVWKHAIRKTVPKLTKSLLALLALALIIVFVSYLEIGVKPLDSWQLPRPVALALEEMHGEALQRVRHENGAISESETKAFDKARVAAWRTVAINHGLAGLDLLDRQARLRLNHSKHVLNGRVAASYSEYRSALAAWRKDVGDELALSVEQNAAQDASQSSAGQP